MFKMKLYNYWVRSYRGYIILQFLKFIFAACFIAPELLLLKDLGAEIRNIETEYRDFIVDSVLTVVIGVVVIYTIIRTVMLILDLIEGPQSKNMRFITVCWADTTPDYHWFWGLVVFRYSLSYDERIQKGNKNKKQREYMKLHGTMSKEKMKKLFRMSSPRFEVVYYRRSKIMIELK